MVPRTTRRRLSLIRSLLLLVLIIGACGGTAGTNGGDGATVLEYARVWPDGFTEQQTIAGNGEIVMKHGEHLERLTISAEDVQRLRDALKQPIPTGTAADGIVRTLTLADGTVIDAPRPDPGTVTVLLDSLMSNHSLG